MLERGWTEDAVTGRGAETSPETRSKGTLGALVCVGVGVLEALDECSVCLLVCVAMVADCKYAWVAPT